MFIFRKKHKTNIIGNYNMNKSIELIYDRQIRINCDKYKTRLIECLGNSFNDNFVCQFEKKDFDLCIINFNLDFYKKYKNIIKKKNLKIIYYK